MRSIVYCSLLKSEIGDILITANTSKLLGISFAEEVYTSNENEIPRYVKKELEEYLQGTRKYFSFY